VAGGAVDSANTTQNKVPNCPVQIRMHYS
jgi:hypothetical protein